MANGLVDFRLIDPNMPAEVGTSWIQGIQQARQDTAQELQNQMAQQQYKNALAEAAAYKESGGDLNKLPDLLINKGLPKQAMAVRKELRQQRESDINSKVQGLKLIEHHGSNIYANPTMDNAVAQVITYAKATGEDPAPLLTQLEATGGNPDKIKQFGLSYALSAKDAIAATQRNREIDISAGRLDVDRGQLAETRRAHNLQYDPNVVANTVTDSAGNVTQFNRFGEVIGTPGKVGKPSATYEKTEALKKQQSIDLDRAIKELTDVTKDGGLIDQSTGGGIGRAIDVTAGFFNKATPGAIAIGKLQPIADMALKMVPRFEGPQSDKDTKSYKEAAGQLADPNMPTEIRKEAGKTVLRLMKERKGQFVSESMAAEGIGAGGTPALPAGFKVDK